MASIARAVKQPSMRRLAVALVVVLVPVTGLADVAAAAPGVQRISGADRYATAAAVSASAFGASVPVAYVTSGQNFPDALAGGPVAALAGGPILLVAPDVIPDPTKAELQRLAPGRIVVLGGGAAVSDAVVSQLSAFTSGGTTHLAGGDRYATAAAISQAAFAAGVPVAFLADGLNFPDALAAGPVAAKDHGPVLLTDPTTLPDPTAAELARLHPAQLFVLGGKSAVSDAVMASAGQAAGATPVRISGADRYTTAAALVATAWNHAPKVFVASGQTFPDALTVSAVAGSQGAPLLLVPSDIAPGSVWNALNVLAPATVVVLGGASAISDPVAAAFGGAPPPLPLSPPGSYAFEHINPNGQPARWDPCAPIHYVVNPANMPSWGMSTLQTVLADLTLATGLTFAYDGTTNEVPDAARDAYQPGRYGARWAPVLVAWETSSGQSNVPLGDGGAGVAAWGAAADSSHPNPIMVGGQIVILTTAPGIAPGYGSYYSFGTVLRHEWGHVLGLGHPSDPNQVMSAVLAHLNVPSGLQPGDLSGLAQVGAAGGCLGSPTPQHLAL